MRKHRPLSSFVSLIALVAGLVGAGASISAMVALIKSAGIPSLLITISWSSLGIFVAGSYVSFLLKYRFRNFDRYGRSDVHPPDAQPSRIGVKLLYLFLPKKQREYLPGCLDEEFTTFILPEFGPRYAKLWYWWQVIRSILATNKWIGWIIGLGGLGGLAASFGAMLKRWLNGGADIEEAEDLYDEKPRVVVVEVEEGTEVRVMIKDKGAD